MKVKELIEKLKEFDPEFEVAAKGTRTTGASTVKDIQLVPMPWRKVDKQGFVEIKTFS